MFADYRAAFKPAAFDFGIGEGESELGDAQYYRLPARRVDVTARLRF